MDTSFNSDFVSSTRTFIDNIVAQDASVSDAAIKLECEGHYSKENSGGSFKFGMLDPSSRMLWCP